MTSNTAMRAVWVTINPTISSLEVRFRGDRSRRTVITLLNEREYIVVISCSVLILRYRWHVQRKEVCVLGLGP